MTPEFTILMPCLNESETLAASIAEANKYAAHLGLSYEILIADNGSADNSREIAEKSGARVITVPEKGYGNALRGGISAAKGKYIIMADCDMSYNFANIKEIAEKLKFQDPFYFSRKFHELSGTPPLEFRKRSRR